MRTAWTKSLLLIILLFLSLSFERVIGVPLISLIVFYHLFFTARTSVQGISLLLFSLLVAALYTTDPVLTAILMVGFFLVLKSISGTMGSLLSWQLLALSCVQAVVLGYLAHLEITFISLFAGVLQFLVSVFFIRKVMFKDIQQSFTWKQKIFSSKVYEKTV